MDGKQGSFEEYVLASLPIMPRLVRHLHATPTFGIPGSSTTAVLLGGLLAWGLKPGPLLFQNEPDFVWGLISSMYIGNVLCLICGLLCIPLLMKFRGYKATYGTNHYCNMHSRCVCHQ